MMSSASIVNYWLVSHFTLLLLFLNSKTYMPVGQAFKDYMHNYDCARNICTHKLLHVYENLYMVLRMQLKTTYLPPTWTIMC